MLEWKSSALLVGVLEDLLGRVEIAEKTAKDQSGGQGRPERAAVRAHFNDRFHDAA